MLTFDQFCAQVAIHFRIVVPLHAERGASYRSIVEWQTGLMVGYCPHQPHWLINANKVPNAYGQGDTLQEALDNFKVSVVQERDKAVQMHDVVLEVLE